MATIPQPPSFSPFMNKDGTNSSQWIAWLGMVASMNNPQSGTTVNRPTNGLRPGMIYFDTTLGKPVFANADGSGWVDATGAAV